MLNIITAILKAPMASFLNDYKIRTAGLNIAYNVWDPGAPEPKLQFCHSTYITLSMDVACNVLYVIDQNNLNQLGIFNVHFTKRCHIKLIGILE